jgi:hypothetical protein
MIEVVPQWSQLHVTGEGLDRVISVFQSPGISIDIGKQGPSGPPGPGATTYDHIQAPPSVEWVVNHNLGRLVSVTVLNAGNVEVEAEVLQVSENQTRIYFNLPQTGKVLVR